MKSTKPECCLEFEFDPWDMFLPNRMNSNGMEFMRARNFLDMKLGEFVSTAKDLGNGHIQIKQTCPKLTPDGRCSIYETRPQICREWQCARDECDFCDRYDKEKLVKTTTSHEYDLSILIPAKNEMFLARTIQDILDNIEANTEIIAVCDGAWPTVPIIQHPRVNVIYHSGTSGQREATNEAARISRAKYVMKIDAHCSFDKGFDRKMLEGFAKVGDDVTMVPIMRNLWAFDWKCYECGWKKYQGPTPTKCEGKKKDGTPCTNTVVYQGLDEPPEELRKAIRRKVLWTGKHNPQSTSYCFDNEPHFQYFEEYKHREVYRNDKSNTGFTESMSLQGSCFMCTREKYWELKLCDENFGSWGNQGIEVALKTWLSGGRVLVNHSTWYGHMFRTQGGDFGFPYDQSGRAVAKCKQKVKDMFFNGMKWDKAIRPTSWLLEKFWPVKGWTDKNLQDLKENENRSGVKMADVIDTDRRSLSL